MDTDRFESEQVVIAISSLFKANMRLFEAR